MLVESCVFRTLEVLFSSCGIVLCKLTVFCATLGQWQASYTTDGSGKQCFLIQIIGSQGSRIVEMHDSAEYSTCDVTIYMCLMRG